MKKKCFIAILSATFSFYSTFGQNNRPSIFAPPLKIPLNISGGFGEIRTNHIHSGIDFRTGGEIGKTVYAAADGFISRIKIEPYGFGRAIYIDHPDGYTTVYGHLDALRDDITEYIRQKQYENQLFPLDVFPKKTDFIVKKGDSIAYSGNAGGSQGPHLHFEIRETVKQSPIQPLLFNFPIADTQSPSFYSVSLYPLSKASRVGGSSGRVSYQIVRSANGNTLNTDIINVTGPVGIGAEVFDAINLDADRTGFYMVSVKLDSTLIFKNELASFNFGESRYINSMIDYAEYMKTRKKITKLFSDPNNKLSTFKTMVNKGIIDIRDSAVHNVELSAFDTYGNKTILRFKIKAKNNASNSSSALSDTCMRNFSFLKENTFAKDSFKFMVPLNALYKDLCLKYSEKPRRTGYFSKTYQVGDSSIPMQIPFEISIKPSGLTPALMEKALIVRFDGNSPTSVGGTVEKDFIKGRTYIMGSFAVTLDTTPPRILPHGMLTTNYQGIRKTYITFRITDNLSGVKEYNCFIDGKWALFEYDAKSNLILHQLDPSRFNYTSNTPIKIVVTDDKNNTSTFETKYK